MHFWQENHRNDAVFFFFFAIDKEAYGDFLSHYWAVKFDDVIKTVSVQFATVITVSSFVIIYREIPSDSVHISVTPNFTLYLGIH